MEARLPPVLEKEETIGERHPLGRMHSCTDSAESKEDLYGPVYIACLRHVPG